MADYPEMEDAIEPSRTGRIMALLEIVGWIAILLSVVFGGYLVVQAGASGDSSEARILAGFGVGSILFGIVMGAALWGISELLRRLDLLQEVTEHAAAMGGNSGGGANNSRLLETHHTFDELVVLMREVRDISLLSEEQRAMRLQVQGRAALEVLQREVPVLLREHNWIEARNRAQEARERFPTFKEWDALEKQIEKMRMQVEEHDIEAAQRQIGDLTALGAWDRVDEVLKELLERHPDSVKAIDLAQKLRVERNRAEAEQRAKLMAQAQEATNNRDWVIARDAATLLIQRFPNSPEAQALRLQMPTLRENAQVKERAKFEGEIRELIKQKRYEPALRIARKLLDDYPNSQQAEALRQMLPKLEDLASSAARR